MFSFWFGDWKQWGTKKYNELWDGINNEIETINGGNTSKHNSVEYDKDFMKVYLDECLYAL